MADLTPRRRTPQTGLTFREAYELARVTSRPIVRGVLKSIAALSVAATVLEYATGRRYTTVFMPEPYWLALLDIIFVGYMLYLCKARYGDR